MPKPLFPLRPPLLLLCPGRPVWLSLRASAVAWRNAAVVPSWSWRCGWKRKTETLERQQQGQAAAVAERGCLTASLTARVEQNRRCSCGWLCCSGISVIQCPLRRKQECVKCERMKPLNCSTRSERHVVVHTRCPMAESSLLCGRRAPIRSDRRGAIRQVDGRSTG